MEVNIYTKLEKITFENEHRYWDRVVAGGYRYDYQLGDKWLKEHVEYMKQSISENIIKASEIDNREKIRFHEKTLYPRTQFTNDFPELKLGRKNCKYIVLGTNYELKHTNHLGYNSVQLGDDGIYREPTSLRCNGTANTKKEILLYGGVAGEHLEELYNILVENPGIKFIYLEELYTLKKNKGVDLTDTLFRTIDKLIQSRKDEDIKVALNLMLGVDYDKYGAYLAFLLNKSYFNISRSTQDVRIKTLMSRIDTDFPYMRAIGNNALMECAKRNDDRLTELVTTFYFMRDVEQIENRYILKKL